MSKLNNQERLLIFPLGGLGEIGKNMYVIEYGEEILVIDAGLKFPEEEMLGIDIVIPDITYLLENQERVQGIFLTHGHEDHIGALPYVLRELHVPVYGTRLTLGLVEGKLREAGIYRQNQLRVFDPDETIETGQFKVSFFRTNHSIPDSVGVCVETPLGQIVHTGDFKFDHTPVNNQHADLHKMAEIGQKGVLCLLSDSTNAERSGFTPSERVVGGAIQDVFEKAEQRIIVATFASNIHRIQQVFEAAVLNGRKVAIVGRSMVNVVNVALELGYLHVPDGLIIDPNQISRLPAEQVVILSTGSQGEPMSALSRMAYATHRTVDILPGDTVIIAATPIPGNERYVGRIIDKLYRIGATVIHGASDRAIHVSGHGNQEDLKLMLNLMKPKYFIPIHGEYRMIKQHGRLAVEVGVEPENIFLLENGDSVEITAEEARYGSKMPSGVVLIDGLGVGDVGNIVLRDRKLLSQDGIVVVVVTLSKQTNQIVSGPDIISRGFVYVRESEELLDDAAKLVQKTLEKCAAENVNEWSSLKNNVRDQLGKFLFDRTRRRPMILPIIMEV